MTTQPDLFTSPAPPNPIDTRREARKSIEPDAQAGRQAILNLLAILGPSTADELAAYLGWSILYVRPRVSELYRDFKAIEDTGMRRRNASQKWATVWRVKR